MQNGEKQAGAPEEALSAVEYGFALPEVYGQEQPSSLKCCELAGELLPSSGSASLRDVRKAVVAGAQKAGTTYLAQVLLQHKQVLRWECYTRYGARDVLEGLFVLFFACRRGGGLAAWRGFAFCSRVGEEDELLL